MGKKAKEHRKKVNARNQRITDNQNRQKKFYKLWVEEQQKGMREMKMAQLIQKNIDEVRFKNPDLFIAQEDGSFLYNTELVTVNETDDVVFTASGIPVFESYSDKKITSLQYLEIIKDLTNYENTQKEAIPEVTLDEPMRNVPEADVMITQNADLSEL